MPLSADIDRREEAEGILRVALVGSLDTGTAPGLKTQLRAAMTDPIRLLVFDAAGLEFVSSAGLQVLIGAQKLLRDKDGGVAMMNMAPQIRKAFEIVRGVAGFSVVSTADELAALCSTRPARGH